MKDLIAYCGLDCETCDARIATVNNDQALREKTAKHWSELNGVEITPEMMTCLGCRAEGPKTAYCESLCPIRRCAMKQQRETCAGCEKLDACEKLGPILAASEQARQNLNRSRL